jgi:hypothetical protein
MVITVRPDTHWRGFWADRLLILVSLLEKALSGHWLKEIGYQRQQYWWRGYRRQAHFQAGGFTVEELFDSGIIVATHSLTHRQVSLFRIPPNRIFAVTARYGSGYHERR